MSTILDMLCERDITPEQREAKRLRAKARRERSRAAREADSEVKSEELSDVLRIGDDKWLEAQWRKANDKYFNGTLQRPETIEWDRAKGRHGVCGADYDPSKNAIYCTRISISRLNVANYASFRNTLVHEMVHQLIYQQYTEEDIRYANSYGRARTRQWWRALSKETGRDGHHGTWLAKAEELMSKFPELRITKYATSVEDDVPEETMVKRANAAATAHVLVRKPLYIKNRRFYYVTDEAYNHLMERIKAGSEIDGWYEYDFDRDKMQERIKEPMTNIGFRYYKIGYFEQLVEDDVIFSRTEKELNHG